MKNLCTWLTVEGLIVSSKTPMNRIADNEFIASMNLKKSGARRSLDFFSSCKVRIWATVSAARCLAYVVIAAWDIIGKRSYVNWSFDKVSNWRFRGILRSSENNCKCPFLKTKGTVTSQNCNLSNCWRLFATSTYRLVPIHYDGALWTNQ